MNDQEQEAEFAKVMDTIIERGKRKQASFPITPAGAVDSVCFLVAMSIDALRCDHPPDLRAHWLQIADGAIAVAFAAISGEEHLGFPGTADEAHQRARILRQLSEADTKPVRVRRGDDMKDLLAKIAPDLHLLGVVMDSPNAMSAVWIRELTGPCRMAQFHLDRDDSVNAQAVFLILDAIEKAGLTWMLWEQESRPGQSAHKYWCMVEGRAGAEEGGPNRTTAVLKATSALLEAMKNG